MNEKEDLEEFYHGKGFGRKLGFGNFPAVLVIDFINAFTDKNSPLGGDFSIELGETFKILSVARRIAIPVIFTTVSYEPNTRDAQRLWLKNQPEGVSDYLASGTEWVKVDSSLELKPDEVVITKKYASAFFGTALFSELNAQRVDTIILAGCTTSGCVRATAVDGISYEFRVIVVKEAVGDRSSLSHKVSLADIDAKYGDVVSSDSVLKYFTSLSGATGK